MKVAIMQPYILPYIGYFQLIKSVDTFVVYDNIQYTKKGWINRNRFLQNGKAVTFSIPIEKDSDYLDVRERSLAPSFNRAKLLNQIRGAYLRAPQFKVVFPLVESILKYDEPNLFKFIYHSIKTVCDYLEIATDIRVSSDINIDHELKGSDKVLAICAALKAKSYVNAIGGVDLYSKDVFAQAGIDLFFLKSKAVEYHQYDTVFVPWLSILDVMMFNTVDGIKSYLDRYELV